MDMTNLHYKDITKLSMEATVVYINELLSTGHSTTTIERAFNLGKDTLRKRLKRGGYHYNKDTHSYVLVTATEGTGPVDVQHPTRVTTNKNKQDNDLQLTKADIVALKKLISISNDLVDLKEALQKKPDVGSTLEFTEFTGLLQGSTLQLHKEVWEALDGFCKKHKVSKKAVVNQALWEFLQHQKEQ